MPDTLKEMIFQYKEKKISIISDSSYTHARNQL